MYFVRVKDTMRYIQINEDKTLEEVDTPLLAKQFPTAAKAREFIDNNLATLQQHFMAINFEVVSFLGMGLS
jgi:hypothetical protein